jgi:putative transposase
MARKVAQYALIHKNSQKLLSSKEVAHIGLKSAISCQVLRKYSKNKKLKRIGRVKLTVPNQHIQINQEDRTIKITCLKLELSYAFPNVFSKINQIELDKEYAFVSVTVPELDGITTTEYIGIDRNATKHIAVCALPTGKILKLGKSAQHIHNKYKYIRKQLQQKGKYKKVKTIKNRESRIVININHKIASKVVHTAKENGWGIKLEKLEGIRKTKKQNKSFKGTLHSWSFYQLQMFLEYKAKLFGIPVVYVNPQYTSQTCHKCGVIGKRTKKEFYCTECGVVEHADVNASFNIAKASPVGMEGIVKLQVDGDICKGSTDTPKKDMQKLEDCNLRTPVALA